jgi:RimJ/RimL family protein N-acetyltransferase
MKLVSVYDHDHFYDSHQILFDLLSERGTDTNISHQRMPIWAQHVAFVESRPYEAWYFIHDPDAIGACYLTKQNEIGVQIIKWRWGQGLGKAAVQELMKLHGPRRYLANINPANKRSIKMFKGLGFELIQHTYAREP